MRKFFILLLIYIICACSVIDSESFINLLSTDSTLITYTRSSITMDGLPDSYDFNVSLSDAEFMASKYSSENKLQELLPYEYDGYTLFYVANYDKGYKVISGDKRTSIFLLESDEGRFEFRDDGEFDGPSFWLDDLAYDILLLKKGEAKVTDASNVLFWNSIVGNDDLRIPNQLLVMSDLDSIDFDDPEHVWAIVPVSENDYCYDEVTVPHILTTKWGQRYPWNTYVPYSGAGHDPSLHCPTGCCAVAMAQVIYYCHFNLGKPNWLYENARTIGTYNDPEDPIIFIQDSCTLNSIRWNEMEVNSDSVLIGYISEYVGHLMADVGHRLGMTYSPDGSRAYITKNGFNEFGVYCDSSYYNMNTVISSLRSNNPVVTTAYSEREWSFGFNHIGYHYSNGHSWVIDGLEAGVREHVTTYEWRRLSELSSNNYPLYSEEQMMYIDPDVYSGKSFEESIRYTQYYYKMNWGYDGSGDEERYGVNDSDSWEYSDDDYRYDKKIWYGFR